MKIYYYSEDKDFINEEYNLINTAICLGEFDGVHLGHKALFDEAKNFGKWGVLLFDRNVKGNKNLTTQKEKIKLIERFGADYIVIVEFSEKFSKWTPEEFTDFLENTLKVSQIICGYDYRFGYMASGESKDLEKLCKNTDIKVLEPVKAGNNPIKSTIIRELIKTGNITECNNLLGYNYKISGKVTKGFGNGRKMGFPTANLLYDPDKLLPPDGVYYGKTFGMDCVINVGKNPTFDAKNRTVEIHILNFEKDLYDSEIETEFLEKIRDDIKFDSIEKLIERINKDIEYVKGREKIMAKRTLTEITYEKAKEAMEKQSEIIKKHQEKGVLFINPSSCYVEENVVIGKGTVVEQNVMLQGDTVIGENTIIGMNSKLVNTKVGNGCELLGVVSVDAQLGDDCLAGPFCYIRPGSKIGNDVKVGDFVEVKNATIDEGTKIAHLTYVGDSDVGKRVNFGCGTVTVNYDGKNKLRCKIGDDAFIGCNTNLVAPVTVGDGAYTAAGSTITDEVPEKCLAIARARQVNKEGWKDKRDR